MFMLFCNGVLGASSVCIILNTLPNSDCSPTPTTTPYEKIIIMYNNYVLRVSKCTCIPTQNFQVTKDCCTNAFQQAHYLHVHVYKLCIHHPLSAPPTFPCPPHTKVPMKAMLRSCEMSLWAAAADCDSVCLREGEVSPVKLDSSISRSTA